MTGETNRSVEFVLTEEGRRRIQEIFEAEAARSQGLVDKAEDALDRLEEDGKAGLEDLPVQLLVQALEALIAQESQRVERMREGISSLGGMEAQS